MPGLAPYLQLLSLQAVQASWGTAQVTWPGGSRLTNGIQVNHGITGSTPRIWTTADCTSINFAALAYNVGATQFSLQGDTIDGSSPAANTHSNIYWIAIG